MWLQPGIDKVNKLQTVEDIMKAIEVSDYDSTCFDAGFSAGHFNDNQEVEYAAIPDIYSGAVRAIFVARKHFSDYVLLKFPDKKEVRIASFIDSSPESAIAEAESALVEESKLENDVNWWQDID